MIRPLRARFAHDLQAEVARRFAIDPAGLEELDGYENLVYGDADRVLRISHDGVKDPEQVLSELRFVAFLAAGGAAVARALPSRGGALLERVPDGHGQHFLATCFKRVPGRLLASEDDGPEILETLGKLMAEMHRLSADYRPEGKPRQAWHRNAHIAEWRRHTADEPAAVRGNIEALYGRLRALPEGPEHAGLIHGDLHSDNLLWDGEHLTAIDFDDCLVGPWGMDLGTAIYHCRRLLVGGRERGEDDQRAFVLRLVERVVRGYARVRPLDQVARRHLADFVRWRQMDLFLYLHHSRATRGLDDEELGYLLRMRADIERGLSPLPLDDERLLAAVEAASG